MQELIVFDLDKTLIAIDTADEWFKYMLDSGVVKNKTKLIQQQLNYEKLYAEAKINMQEYVEFSLQPFSGMELTQFNQHIKNFIKDIASKHIYTQARELINSYIAKGVDILLISATISNIVKPIGKELGFDEDNVLAIDIATQDNKIIPKTQGVLTFKEGKVSRLIEWSQTRNICANNITFYSDSINDLALLKYAKTAIATNPSKELYLEAKKRNWQIINFTK